MPQIKGNTRTRGRGKTGQIKISRPFMTCQRSTKQRNASRTRGSISSHAFLGSLFHHFDPHNFWKTDHTATLRRRDVGAADKISQHNVIIIYCTTQHNKTRYTVIVWTQNVTKNNVERKNVTKITKPIYT